MSTTTTSGPASGPAWIPVAADPPETVHEVRVVITDDLMREMFRTSDPNCWFRVTEGVPADAEFAGMRYDLLNDRMVLHYRHPSFPAVPPGTTPPDLTPKLSALHATAEQIAGVLSNERVLAALDRMEASERRLLDAAGKVAEAVKQTNYDGPVCV